MMLGTLMLTVQDAVSKWLIDDFSVGEILVYRGIWAYIPLAWFAYRAGGVVALHSKRPGVNVLRALANTGAGFAVITAYAYMPLADAMAIMFASPILVTALAFPLLKEHVGWRRWCAIIVGFAGVLIMLRPGAHFALVALLPLGGAALVAARDILTRKLGNVDSSTTILFYTITVSVLAGLCTFPFTLLTAPSGIEWSIFATMGLVNGVAHYCTIKAFSLADVTVLSPLRYFALVWAAIIGYLVWADVPGKAMLFGAVLVVGSAIYIIVREARIGNHSASRRTP